MIATHSLNIKNPKVACLCAKEKVSFSMPSTVDAQKLQEHTTNGDITGCSVGGHFAPDNAISIKSAQHKNIAHPVAGNADILLVSDIESGNILYKSLSIFVSFKVQES